MSTELILRDVYGIDGAAGKYLGLPRRMDDWWLLSCDNASGSRCTLAGDEPGFHRYVEPLLDRRPNENPHADDDRWDVELGPEVLEGFQWHALGWVSEWTEEEPNETWSWRWSFHGESVDWANAKL